MLLATRHLSSVLLQVLGTHWAQKQEVSCLSLCPSRLRSPSGAAEAHGMAKCVAVRHRSGKSPLLTRSLVPLSGSAMFNKGNSFFDRLKIYPYKGTFYFLQCEEIGAFKSEYLFFKKENMYFINKCDRESVTLCLCD